MNRLICNYSFGTLNRLSPKVQCNNNVICINEIHPNPRVLLGHHFIVLRSSMSTAVIRIITKRSLNYNLGGLNQKHCLWDIQ